MAQIVIVGPSTAYALPNQREYTVEGGVSFKQFCDSCNTMFAELYEMTGPGSAQITLRGPESDYELPNQREYAKEVGDSFKTVIDQINGMFTELYSMTGGTEDVFVTLRGPASHYYLPNQREYTVEHGDPFRKIVNETNAMFTEVYVNASVAHFVFSTSSFTEDKVAGNTVCIVSIEGPYTGGPPSYSLTATDGGKLAINSSTGAVTLVSAYNYDAGQTSATFIVAVANIDPIPNPRSKTLTVINVVEDTTPTAFTFTDLTGASPSTIYESNVITIAGMDGPGTLTVTGGEYNKNGQGYTSTASTAVNGDLISVRRMSSSSYNSAVSVVLSVGGNVTAATTDTYTITTFVADTTPAAFTFTDVTNAAISTMYVSNTITVSGVNIPSTVTVTGGEYSKNGGAYTSFAGLASNGDTFSVRRVSSSSYTTAVTVVLSIGGNETAATTDTYSITTLTEGTTPAPFTFVDQSGLNISTLTTSNTITVSGVTSSCTVTITGGEYSKNGGAYVTTAGTATNGDTFSVRGFTSGSYSTAVNIVLSIGGDVTPATTDTFTITTLVPDTTPAAFSFTDVTGATASTLYTSNTITVSGVNIPSTVTITGGEYSKNGAAFTTSAGTAINADTLQVRTTSSSSYNTAVNAVLSVGGNQTAATTDTYTVTTLVADTTPAAFTFTDITGATASTLYTSNVITISGVNIACDVSITGGQYSKNGGAYTSAAGSCVNGDTFSVQTTSSSSYSTAVNVVLSVGGNQTAATTDTYTVTTLVADTTPAAFTFTDITDASLSTVYTSNLITISGVNIACDVSVTGGQYSKNGAAYTSSAGSCVSGDTFRVRATSSGSYLTAVNVVLSVGGNQTAATTDTYTVTTMEGVATLPTPTLNLEPDADSGSSATDNITNIANLIFAATNLVDGATVHLLRNGVQVATTTATGSSFTFSYTAPEAAGDVYTIWQEYLSEYSDSSANETVTVDLTAPTISTSSTASVAENAVLAVTLAASESVTWSITGGADVSRFEISGTTLRWLSNGTKNYEAPDDADTNNVYVVQVTAVDVAGSATNKTISVTVTDVVEGPAAGTLFWTFPIITKAA